MRERVAAKEKEIAEHEVPEREHIIAEELRAHHADEEEILSPEYRLSEETIQS